MKLLLIAFLIVPMLGFSQANPIDLTLNNNSFSSIPLHIPGVMNPNLSPKSNSGVSFDEGQKVYFYIKKKKYLLFEATLDMDNSTIIVNEWIEKRKEELDLLEN